MGRTIAIANQKGGVGKTTTAVNLAVALADLQKRVLLIDLDPQGNATSGLAAVRDGVAPRPLADRTVYETLTGRRTMLEIIRPVRHFLFLAPAGPDLVGAEIEMASMEARERRLLALMEPVVGNYDYLLIDTPPSLGLLTLNALVAAGSVLVPMQCEYYALEGLSALLGTIRRVKAGLNPALELEGLVLTMFDQRNRLSHEIARNVKEHFPDKVFATAIHRNVRLSESPSHGLSVFEYDPKSVGARSYGDLARELLTRADPAQAPAPPVSDNGDRG